MKSAIRSHSLVAVASKSRHIIKWVELEKVLNLLCNCLPCHLISVSKNSWWMVLSANSTSWAEVRRMTEQTCWKTESFSLSPSFSWFHFPFYCGAQIAEWQPNKSIRRLQQLLGYWFSVCWEDGNILQCELWFEVGFFFFFSSLKYF